MAEAVCCKVKSEIITTGLKHMHMVLCWPWPFGIIDCVLSLKELVVPEISNKPVVEPILPQLSPGVSIVKMEATFPGVCFFTFML